MASGRTGFATSLARPVELSGAWNASDEDVAGRFHPHYHGALARLPDGPAVFRGLPFALGSRAAGRRWLLVGDESTVDLRGPGGTTQTGGASHLVVAHFADSWRDPAGERPPSTPVGWVLPTGEPLARYELTFADGASRSIEVRRRFEIADGIIGWGFVPFAAIGHRADEPVDWRGPHPRQVGGRRVDAGQAGLLAMLPGAWGAAQVGIADFVPTAEDDITYWLHAIPLGGAEPVGLRVVPLGGGRPGTDVVIAGLTLFHGTADPLVTAPRRQLLVAGTRDVPAVDLGIALGPRAVVDRPSVGDGPVGWGRLAATGPDRQREGSVIDLVATPDAQLRYGDWEVAVGDIGDIGDRGAGRAGGRIVSPDGRISIEPLAPADVRVDVRVSVDGEATPARVRFVAADGRYLPPLGHREELDPALLEDTGAGVIVGEDTYAYVPGAFRIDLPPGTVDVEVIKGFDHRPVRRTLTIEPGARELEIAIERSIDLRAEGWRAADSHVHFLAPSTALLQAAAEDLTFVHLLATQLGDAYTNVTDLAWGSQADPSGRHFVIVGTENRQNVLGHLALLGARRPVVPMASGGGPEGRIGGEVRELLAEWADRCHAEGGLVVGAHFPLPLAEIAADVVAGRIDAVEMQTFAPGLDNPSIGEWYRYLNCGYRLPILGGTDKMSAEMPVGAIRTVARLDPEAAPTFAAWSAAVRAGRTFATSGPVIELSVDGHEPGDVLSLPTSGGRLEARVRVRAAQPVVSVVELVVNGRVVASQEAPGGGGDDVALTASVDVRAGAWIAARSRSDHEIHSAYNTSMAAHTSPVYVEVADHPLFVADDATAILAVIDGTVRWLETMATIGDPAVRARMAGRIAESGALLRERGGTTQTGGPAR